MKKIILLFLIGVFLIGSCAQQNSTQNQNQDQADLDGQAGDTAADEVKEFNVAAKQFEFVPGTIEVNKGDRVKLVVTSTDVDHGIMIPDYGINERLPVGEPVTIEFVADKEGSFPFICSVICGSGHKSMKGTLVVK